MSMAHERVVFDNTVHGLFQIALQGELSPDARRAMRLAGLDLDQKLLPAYPLPIWVRCLEIAVQDIYPHLPREEAYRQLGHQIVLGVSETVLGRGMLALGRALGPRRMLMRMNHNFRNADNFVQARLTELSPTCFEVQLNETLGLPTYFQGILEAALAASGARAPTVGCLREEPPGCTYRVQWQPECYAPSPSP
jgi:uncharacterized protein (TIGR02265 family)